MFEIFTYIQKCFWPIYVQRLDKEIYNPVFSEFGIEVIVIIN